MAGEGGEGGGVWRAPRRPCQRSMLRRCLARFGTVTPILFEEPCSWLVDGAVLWVQVPRMTALARRVAARAGHACLEGGEVAVVVLEPAADCELRPRRVEQQQPGDEECEGADHRGGDGGGAVAAAPGKAIG